MEKKEERICEYCGKDDFETSSQLQAHMMTCKSKNIQEREEEIEERAERVPFGTPGQRFNVPKEDGYVYRVFNDKWRIEPGRIQRARAAGYEFVEDEQSGSSVGTNEDGSEVKGVLMRIPKELYDEDQALKNKELDKVDKQIQRQALDADLSQAYGDVKIETKLTG